MTVPITRRVDHEIHQLQLLIKDLLELPDEQAISEFLMRVAYKQGARYIRLRNRLIRMGCQLLLFQCRKAAREGMHLGHPSRAGWRERQKEIRASKQAREEPCAK